MDPQITVATMLSDKYSRQKVNRAATAAGGTCINFRTESDLLAALGGGGPRVLVMLLDGSADSALALQKRLRNALETVAVVYLTGIANIDSVVRAVQLGATAVLPRHCTSAELSESLRRAAETHELRSEWVSETHSAGKKFDLLSERQREVLAAVVAGHTNKAIALRMKISIKTVEKHRGEVHRKTETTSLPELVRLKVMSERCLEHAYGLTAGFGQEYQSNSLLENDLKVREASAELQHC